MGVRANFAVSEDYIDIPGQDIEICAHFEDLHKLREVFNAEFNFCSLFGPGRSYYNDHLAQDPRFKGNVSSLFLTPITA